MIPQVSTLLLCIALLTLLPTSAADVHRVAISDFTTDENEWESIKALAEFAPALQAELAKEPAVEWVERSELVAARKELELSAAFGQPDLPGAVRRARWSKADWLVTGSFSSEDGARELLVEVIDLAHADVLALWLALGRDGVATLDPATGELRRFGAEDGLEVQTAYRLAAAGGRVFLTANMMEGFVWKPDAKRWSAWETKFPGHEFGGFGGDLRRVAGVGSWLLLYQGLIGVCDVGSPTWTRYDAKLADHGEGVFRRINDVAADARGFWLGGDAGLHFIDPQSGETVDYTHPLYPTPPGYRPSVATAVEALLKRRTQVRERAPGTPHPLRLTSRVAGTVTALASDGDHLWVATTAADSHGRGGQVMLLHKPTDRWIGQFPTTGVASMAVDETHLWLGGRRRYTAHTNCLSRLEKCTLYDIPQDRWMVDTVSEAEARAAFEKLGVREQALWHFTGGEYAASAELLAKIEPQTAETLFLQGLCYDAGGLDQPEKTRAFFTQTITAHPSDPLAEEARKQLAHAADAPLREPPGRE